MDLGKITVQNKTEQARSQVFFFFFYGEVRSNNETDQTMPEAQVSGMGNCIASVSKNLVFLKL